MDYMTTIAAAAFGGGLLVFVQFLINRHDQKNGVMAEIKEKLDALKLETETTRMINARRYIFYFRNAVQRGEEQNREEWNQCIEDIRDYKMYCKRHPDFVNDRCDATIELIETMYRERLSKNNFMED